MPEPIISVEEARQILGNDAIGMSDEQILEVVGTLDLLAKDALKQARLELARKRDAKQLAELIYDVYQEKKMKSKDLQP